MTYQDLQDLPKGVKNALPHHGQEIYKEAYNHAWKTYKNPDKRATSESRETVAHKVAWAAVENKYQKKEGAWVAKKP